jgi:hypothetical protein
MPFRPPPLSVGPAFYGVVHERGGSGPYEITATKARALHFIFQGRERFFRSVTHPAAKARAVYVNIIEGKCGLDAGRTSSRAR